MMELSERKKSLANEVLKEFDEMEKQRRENQHKEVFTGF